MTSDVISPDNIQAENILDSYSLSPLQQGMLFHTLRDKGVGMYISQAVTRYENLDVEALQGAWQLAVDRHSILRTSFHWNDPENPVQRVHDKVKVPYESLDWRGITPGEQNAKLHRFQREQRERGFELNKPALLKISVIRVSHSRWFCVHSHHHIILDGWSGALLAAEVGRAYEALRCGREPVLNPARSFGGYIRWIEQQDLSKAEKFWRQHLDSVNMPTPMPAERELGNHGRVRMYVESWSIKLDDEVTVGLNQLARHSKVTLNTVIQSAWAILLSRYSGRKHVLFGCLVAGRPPSLEGVESIVGMFLNTLPFRVTIDPGLALDEWLYQLHLNQIELQEFEHSPLMLVQQWSRIPSGLQLFDSIVARKDVTQSGKTSGSARPRASERRYRSNRSEQSNFQQNYSILLNITASDGIELKMTYDARRFESSDIARIMEQLRHLFREMTESPSRPLGELSLLSPEERNLVLFGWNNTQNEGVGTQCLHRIVEQRSVQTPGNNAISFAGTELTYTQLNRQANSLGRYLQGWGIKPRTTVILYMNRSAELVIALLALLKIGARIVPLDVAAPDGHKRAIIHVLNPHAVVTQQSLLDTLPGGEFKKLCIDSEPDLWIRQSSENLSESILVEDVAVVFYHGTPDGHGISNTLSVSHRAIVEPITSGADPMSSGDSIAIRAPVDGWDFFWALFSCWHHGAKATLLADGAKNSALILMEAFADPHLTRVQVTPRLLSACLEFEDFPVTAGHIKYWYCSGGTLSPELCDRFGQLLPGGILVNRYSTVATGPCLHWRALTDSNVTKGVRLGLPIPNVCALVLDDHLQPCPVGIAGELFIGGAGLADFQNHATGASQANYIANPLAGAGEGRLFKTGDFVRRWSDGSIEYLGRSNDQIKDSALGDAAAHRAERFLLQQDWIAQAAVVFRNDSDITAFLVPRVSDLDLARLHKDLTRKLPPQSTPTHYVLVDQLSLTYQGRLDRQCLLDNPERGVASTTLREETRHPGTELEQAIAEVWMDVLRIDRISINDNFFELGGHSLSATKVTARLTNILQSDIQLKAIFEAPTIAKLAAWIQSDKREEELPFSIAAADRGKEAPLTFTQQQLWVLGQLFPSSPTYTIPSNTYFKGIMNLDALKLAFRDVVERHEVLRTTFFSRNGEPVQVVNPTPDDIPLELLDVTDLPENERLEKARWHGAQLGKIPWNFERGPLMRPQLVKLAETEYVLNTVFHHIISDGPSMRIFVGELGKFYNAHACSLPVRATPLPLQFADFAIWERENVKGKLFQRQLDYWRENLAGAQLLEIPTDYPRPAVHGFFGKKVKFQISEEIVLRLRKFGTAEGATTFMTLLAVFQLLLFRYSGQEDVLVGTAMTNRIRVELERLIGLFVNTLTLRTNYSGDPSFREVLRRVSDCCRGAFANMDLPFEETIAEIQPQRDLSRQGSPLFQFMLIHNAAGGGKPGKTKGPNKKAVREGFRPGDPHNDTGHANFDLLLSTSEQPDGTVKFTMVYDTELFRPETIDLLIAHFILLFQKVTEDPDIPISELAMSDDAERIDLLERWNDRLVEPETRCVHDVIQQNAAVNPQYPALVFAGEMLSYGALENKSNQIARYLIDIGVGPEVLVSVCLNRGIDLIVALLGILKAGGAFVPLDPAYPLDRLRYILRDTSSRVLISTGTDFDPSIIGSDMNTRVVDIRTLPLDEFSSEPVKSEVLGRNLAYVIYTSGSSGTPKGVLVEHRNLSNIIRAQVKAFCVHPGCRVLQMMSLSFDAAIGEVFRTLTAGATLYLAHRDDLLPGAGLVNILKDNKISSVAMSPTALAAMPDVSDELPDLETITVGGEACSPSVAEKWGKNRRILNGYGPTETTIGATLGAEWDLKGKPPLGKPLDGVHVYVLDKQMQPTPVGIPGELYIGGVGVSRGYLNSPDLTEKHFLPNPFSTEPDARIYRTGDLVRWLSNGNLDFLGRIDKQVKIRGFRVELGEIESALVQHPAVALCAVSMHEYKGMKRLVAYLVFLENETTGSHELRKFLKDLLPEYMVPALFIELTAMPLDNSGKIDRKALPEPNVDEYTSKTEYVAPATHLEQQLARLWQDVLGLKQVGVNDNFFELGGDSISAIRVVSRAEELAASLEPRDIFLHQSIAELAQFLEDAEVIEKHAVLA